LKKIAGFHISLEIPRGPGKKLLKGAKKMKKTFVLFLSALMLFSILNLGRLYKKLLAHSAGSC